jgi:hypothetical protein
MNLEKLLKEKKSAIQGKWLDKILETYPADTKRFLRKQKDQFANPVGHTISKEIQSLYTEALCTEEIDPVEVSPILDRIIRIRAVQDFAPSQAVAIIFLLKKVIREELGSEIQENSLHDELLAFESRIDDLALLAFDIYMKCREKIYEIRANEASNQVSRLLQRAGLISQVPEWKSNSQKGNDL